MAFPSAHTTQALLSGILEAAQADERAYGCSARVEIQKPHSKPPLWRVIVWVLVKEAGPDGPKYGGELKLCGDEDKLLDVLLRRVLATLKGRGRG
jgi:hypothetical protein